MSEIISTIKEIISMLVGDPAFIISTSVLTIIFTFISFFIDYKNYLQFELNQELCGSYPFSNPYEFVLNSPIYYWDLLGLQEEHFYDVVHAVKRGTRTDAIKKGTETSGTSSGNHCVP